MCVCMYVRVCVCVCLYVNESMSLRVCVVDVKRLYVCMYVCMQM